uniref:G protein-coupled receptor 146 n=2 Tax=Latimeria chalumnae TaxID=7897 RepID=H2ZVC4_LATCH
MWMCILSQQNSNSTSFMDGQHALGVASSVLSIAYAMLCLPLGLLFNFLILVVNFGLKSSAKMPDVYFTNMALAGLVLNVVSALQVLGPDHLLWPLWNSRQELCTVSFIFFNMAALVSVYSTVLFGLDYCIEMILPHTYISSAYNTKHVCHFLWGGATLASFPSLLFYICSKVADKAHECSKLQTKEAGDAIMFFTGFVVPSAGMAYSLWLLFFPKTKWVLLLRADSSRLDLSLRRLLLTTASLQFLLWLPYYSALLVDITQASFDLKGKLGGPGVFQFLKGFSELLAFTSSSVVPLLYKSLRNNFSSRLREFLGETNC